MFKSSLLCSAALGAALLVGCNKDEEKPMPVVPRPSNPTTGPSMRGPTTMPGMDEMRGPATRESGAGTGTGATGTGATGTGATGTGATGSGGTGGGIGAAGTGGGAAGGSDNK
jgi:hypothetical protein